jgi:hypothetical protein
MWFHFTIRDLLLLILAIALIPGAWSFNWESTRINIYSPLSDNAGFFFSIKLALLAVATCLTQYGGPSIRRFSIGYVEYGWMFLASCSKAVSEKTPRQSSMIKPGSVTASDFPIPWSTTFLSKNVLGAERSLRTAPSGCCRTQTLQSTCASLA